MKTTSGLDVETLDRLGELYRNSYLKEVAELVAAVEALEASPFDYGKILAVETKLERMKDDYTRLRVCEVHRGPKLATA